MGIYNTFTNLMFGSYIAFAIKKDGWSGLFLIMFLSFILGGISFLLHKFALSEDSK